MDIRVGHGFDVHRLTENRKLILCGVEIPYEKGLLGHSDADVAAHALMDAMLGGAAMGDIGKHFPDTDQTYCGADSLELMAQLYAKLQNMGFSVLNADVTIIAQKPKLFPFIEKMRERIAVTLCMSLDRVNIKATTTEGLGFTGTGEGIAAEAVCLLVKQ